MRKLIKDIGQVMLVVTGFCMFAAAVIAVSMGVAYLPVLIGINFPFFQIILFTVTYVSLVIAGHAATNAIYDRIVLKSIRK